MDIERTYTTELQEWEQTEITVFQFKGSTFICPTELLK